ncbi:MAG: hypothetical protein A3J79_04350 [Elusimicrobia bacterium RIFOXYB2_FULL_62_6]|nr:MAG: hypothetical protein A3J79_04350 [Elusimicrobia bacterium RIFOXYB2_FULL_62_6]
MLDTCGIRPIKPAFFFVNASRARGAPASRRAALSSARAASAASREKFTVQRRSRRRASGFEHAESPLIPDFCSRKTPPSGQPPCLPPERISPQNGEP